MFIQTYLGNRVDIVNPDPDDISILDIAHALSNICRFNGHTLYFYSVAQHCCIIAAALARKDVTLGKYALLHDAAEAYMSDLAAPIKELVPPYRVMENNLLRVILQKFGLPSAIPAEVLAADQALGVTEAKALIYGDKEGWGIDDIEPMDVEILPLSPMNAEAAYLKAVTSLSLPV